MKLSALLAPPVRASHHDEIMMSGANHQAPFGIVCFREAACGDGATGSGSVACAAVAHCPAALCVILYRPPLRPRLAVGECCARRCCPIFLDSSVEGGRVRFLRGVRRSGKCCAIYAATPRFALPCVAPPIGSARRVPVPRSFQGAAKVARCPSRRVVFSETAGRAGWSSLTPHCPTPSSVQRTSAPSRQCWEAGRFR